MSVFKKIYKYFARKEKTAIVAEKKYFSLSATSEASDIDAYTESLNEALGDESVTNIAISGAYGSGKSSFINTYIKNNLKGNECLSISVAYFGRGSRPDVKSIEKAILQQIIYKSKPGVLLGSKIDRVRDNKRDYLSILPFFFLMLSIMGIFYGEQIGNALAVSHFLYAVWEFLQSPFGFRSFLFYLLFISSALVLNKIYNYLSGVRIHEIIAGGSGVKLSDIGNGVGKSILNDYLDEILYAFEICGYEYVFIEDLDRCGEMEVFKNLRELNFMLNHSDQIDKQVKFIYAIKDDFFENENDRTKFFEFIIPIVPHVDSSNSYGAMLNYPEFSGINTKLLKTISFALHDMRVINNIYNEYVVYSKVNSAVINQSDKTVQSIMKSKLLALIVYKNIMPEDFNSLYKSSGIVYDILKNREFVSEIVSDIDEKIQKIKDRIEYLESLHLENIKELRSVYTSQLIKNLIASGHSNFSHLRVRIEGEVTSFQEIWNCNEDSFGLIMIVDSRNHRVLSIDDLKESIGESHSFSEKMEALGEGASLELKSLSVSLKRWEFKKKQLRSTLRVKDIKDFYDVSSLLLPYTNNELITYFLIFGFIDEEYRNYISIFREGVLSQRDQLFCLSVSISKLLPFDTDLDSVISVIDELLEEDFRKPTVLNFKIAIVFFNENKYLGRL